MRPVRAGQLRGFRQLPGLVQRVDRKVILFDSWHGSFSDSPRAISEELHRIGSGHEHVWTVASGTEAPGWATPVEFFGRSYLSYLGRAGYVVANVSLPAFYRKKPGTTYLQTWHGTPLKRIAFDIEGETFANRPEYLRDLTRDVANWDALVSPNGFSTEIFRGAFRYSGRILETGYPRNDLLSDPRAGEIRSRVRATLGIDDGVPVVLYAPTWRDSHDFALELDVTRLLNELPEHVLLLRLHQLVSARQMQAHPRMRDVSAYPDNRELYLAADVLVTDYSSVMFDFAVTHKPMLFLAYDLSDYRDEMRGFYFDFEREAPGPLVADTGALIETLSDLEAVARAYEPAYAAFHARFCELEDGAATRRVIDAVFD